MDTVREFTSDDLAYHSRHTLLPGFGKDALLKLSEASVAVVGSGGLGCPAVAQLVAAGVGRLRLIDPDNVDLSNLLRQSLYLTRDVGKSKASCAARRAREINPRCEVVEVPRPFQEDDLRDCDVVLDCTDNLPTREAIARSARAESVPLVFGAALGYEGRVTTFSPQSPACLGCMLSQDSEPGSCGEAGVFAPATAIVGTLMAAEAIKWITCLGRTLTGLLVYNALTAEFREFEIVRKPDCRICGQGTPRANGVPTISVRELAAKRADGENFVLLDVREEDELEISRLDPCVHIPASEVLWRSTDLPQDVEIYVLCRTGNRSGTITQALQLRGFTNVRNVAGGINAYAEEIDPTIDTY